MKKFCLTMIMVFTSVCHTTLAMRDGEKYTPTREKKVYLIDEFGKSACECATEAFFSGWVSYPKGPHTVYEQYAYLVSLKKYTKIAAIDASGKFALYAGSITVPNVSITDSVMKHIQTGSKPMFKDVPFSDAEKTILTTYYIFFGLKPSIYTADCGEKGSPRFDIIAKLLFQKYTAENDLTKLTQSHQNALSVDQKNILTDIAVKKAEITKLTQTVSLYIL